MTEPEVSLNIAIKYIQNAETLKDVKVSIDGAHIKTKDTIHFDIDNFMLEHGWKKCDSDFARWQGEYQTEHYAPRIIISSKPGIGDVVISLTNGKTLYIESKKFKSQGGGEYPAMREAIGQLMTGCPDDEDIIPVVAVSYSAKSIELSEKWSKNERIRNAGIHFMLVYDNGTINMV